MDAGTAIQDYGPLFSFATTLALAVYIFLGVDRKVEKETTKLELLKEAVQKNADTSRDRSHELGQSFSLYPQRTEMDRRISEVKSEAKADKVEVENRMNGRVDRMEQTLMSMLNEIKNDVKDLLGDRRRP